MSTVNIVRIKCDACSHTLDEQEVRHDAWMRIDVKRPDDDGFGIQTIDLCAKCAGIFMKRCAEVGIKL